LPATIAAGTGLKRSHDKSQRAIAAAAPDERRSVMELDGIGRPDSDQAELAASLRARAREMCRIAREELCDQPPTRTGAGMPDSTAEFELF
jgi:hypothetical protein